jgi:hypothetical protein
MASITPCNVPTYHGPHPHRCVLPQDHSGPHRAGDLEWGRPGDTIRAVPNPGPRELRERAKAWRARSTQQKTAAGRFASRAMAIRLDGLADDVDEALRDEEELLGDLGEDARG